MTFTAFGTPNPHRFPLHQHPELQDINGNVRWPPAARVELGLGRIQRLAAGRTLEESVIWVQGVVLPRERRLRLLPPHNRVRHGGQEPPPFRLGAVDGGFKVGCVRRVGERPNPPRHARQPSRQGVGGGRLLGEGRRGKRREVGRGRLLRGGRRIRRHGPGQGQRRRAQVSGDDGQRRRTAGRRPGRKGASGASRGNARGARHSTVAVATAAVVGVQRPQLHRQRVPKHDTGPPRVQRVSAAQECHDTTCVVAGRWSGGWQRRQTDAADAGGTRAGGDKKTATHHALVEGGWPRQTTGGPQGNGRWGWPADEARVGRLRADADARSAAAARAVGQPEPRTQPLHRGSAHGGCAVTKEIPACQFWPRVSCGEMGSVLSRRREDRNGDFYGCVRASERTATTSDSRLERGGPCWPHLKPDFAQSPRSNRGLLGRGPR